MLRFKNGAICFVFPAHLIILWIFHRTVAAYPVWHYAQRGSGTSTDGPGVLQRGCCLLTGSQPSGDSWDSEPVTVSGDVLGATRGGGGVKTGADGVDVFERRVKDAEGAADLTSGNCNRENIADVFGIYVHYVLLRWKIHCYALVFNVCSVCGMFTIPPSYFCPCICSSQYLSQ